MTPEMILILIVVLLLFRPKEIVWQL